MIDSASVRADGRDHSPTVEFIDAAVAPIIEELQPSIAAPDGVLPLSIPEPLFNFLNLLKEFSVRLCLTSGYGKRRGRTITALGSARDQRPFFCRPLPRRMGHVARPSQSVLYPSPRCEFVPEGNTGRRTILPATILGRHDASVSRMVCLRRLHRPLPLFMRPLRLICSRPHVYPRHSVLQDELEASLEA